MKFLLMMNTPRGGEYQVMEWPKEDLQRHIAFMMNFSTRLRASGELVVAEGLASPAQAKLVRAGSNGKPITDGPFAESKEFLAGYWIVDVPNAQRAYEIAADASAAPGLRGEPLNMDIEVREIMSCPPPLD